MNTVKTRLNTLTFIPELAKAIGLESAIVIQQITYWIEKTHHKINQKPWIYNTFDQWHQQFPFFSLSTVKRIFYRLEKMGLITSQKMNVHKSDHTKWYTLNFDELNAILEKHIPSKSIKEKKFISSQDELSLSQNESIYISNKKNNLQKNNYLSKSNENLESKKFVIQTKLERQKETFSEKEMEICHQMIKVWNEVFTKQEDKITFSDRRGEKLISLWSSLMEQNIEKWQEFCLKINSSKFLMGEKDGSKFKAYSNWLLQEDVAKRIITGDYGVGDRIPEIKREEKAHQMLIAREKLIEEQIAKSEEYERQEQIKEISHTLQQQAISSLESQWNEEEKQRVNEEYGAYLFENYKWVFTEYRLKGMDSSIVSLHYDYYLIEKYFNNDKEQFLVKAAKLVNIKVMQSLGVG